MFQSKSHMLGVHEAMFGEVGRRCAEIAHDRCALWGDAIQPLAVRVVLAPVELGPYGRHCAYCHTDGVNAFILLNRFTGIQLGVRLDEGRWPAVEDTIVHELTHIRQHQLIAACGIKVNATRGSHRDNGWYQAISEACPGYLGFSFPRWKWPRMKSIRVKVDGRSVVRKAKADGTESEWMMTHWPASMRDVQQVLATM